MLKLFLTRYINNICVSKAVQKEIPAASIVISNPYDEERFKVIPDNDRNIDLVYLGRLVSDKGVDTLLDALAILKNKNITPRLNIIGNGPELNNLQRISERLKLQEQVNFLGNKSGQALVNILNQHKIMVIPSKWEEPYGIVALEGLACGLRIIASMGGGLPEAIKEFGEYFTRNDSTSLAEKIEKALYQSKNNLYELDSSGLSAHLSKHYKKFVAKTYLISFEQRIC